MKTIIVGIDGSHAAITAALWGVDEAISRAVPLRLVSVIKPTHPSPDDYDRDLAHAERSLREAQSAVEAAGKLVKIETRHPPRASRPGACGGIARRRDDLRRLRGNRALRQLDLGFDGNRAGRKGALPGRRHALISGPASV
ncbi:Universal stress protein family [Mycobacterium tuberculosis]|nr:Universal stress protein family [Mycobacterium tuberculosis]